MLPGDCVVEADIRLPVGISGSMLRAEIDRILENYPEVTVEGIPQDAGATYSDPKHEMVHHIQSNAESLIGHPGMCRRPMPRRVHYTTRSRHFRRH